MFVKIYSKTISKRILVYIYSQQNRVNFMNFITL